MHAKSSSIPAVLGYSSAAAAMLGLVDLKLHQTLGRMSCTWSSSRMRPSSRPALRSDAMDARELLVRCSTKPGGRASRSESEDCRECSALPIDDCRDSRPCASRLAQRQTDKCLLQLDRSQPLTHQEGDQTLQLFILGPSGQRVSCTAV